VNLKKKKQVTVEDNTQQKKVSPYIVMKLSYSFYGSGCRKGYIQFRPCFFIDVQYIICLYFLRHSNFFQSRIKKFSNITWNFE